MRRERISELPFETLLNLADTYGVDYDDAGVSSREKLEDLLFDALEEVRADRARWNTYPVALQEQRYSDIEDFSDFTVTAVDEEYELPQRYNLSRIELLLRDPAWAFAYWDISDIVRRKMTRDHGFKHLLIRLWRDVEVDRPHDDHATKRDAIDIPVEVSDSQWYINLPARRTRYSVDLVAQFVDGEMTIASSATVSVPRGSLARDLDVVQSFEVDAMIALSGVENLGVVQFGERIPQRILDLIEHEFADS